MQTGSDVHVAILSSRSTLDLAINTWVPGYHARSSTDLDVAVDFTRNGGLIVIDLLHAAGPESIRTLRERGVDTPIVVLASGNPSFEPPTSGGVVVATSTAIGELSAAFAEALAQHRSRAPLGLRRSGSRSGSGSGRVATTRSTGSVGASSEPAVIDLRDAPVEATADAWARMNNGDTAGGAARLETRLEVDVARQGEVAAARDPSFTSSEENGTRTGEVATPSAMFASREPPRPRRRDRRGAGGTRFGLRLRRSRPARALPRDSGADVPDSGADVPAERAQADRSLASDADRGSPPCDAEPLKMIDLTDPLFPSTDRSATGSEPCERQG